MDNLIELAMQIIFCLLIAAIIGAIIGYLLGKMSKCDKDDYDLEPRDRQNEKKIINDYAQKLTQKEKKVIGLFAVIDEQIIKSFQFPLYLTDATTLKTMIRSNPGVIKLEYGTVTEKYAWRNLK